MKIHRFIALLALLTASAHAVVAIDWGAGAQTIAGDSDVSTAGTLVGAFDIVGGPTTINGVAFQSLPALVGATSATSGNFTLSTPGFTSAVTGANAAGVSAAYNTLLGTWATGQTSVTLTITGLTVGHTYQFQFWSDNSAVTPVIGFPLVTATAVNGVTLDSNTIDSIGGRGQFALGTFVADATGTEAIAFTADNNNVLLNGFQLRDVPAVVPEPSTWLAGFAALGVAALHCRRGAKKVN